MLKEMLVLRGIDIGDVGGREGCDCLIGDGVNVESVGSQAFKVNFLVLDEMRIGIVVLKKTC